MVSPMNAVCMQYIYIYIAMKKTFDSDKTTSIQLVCWQSIINKCFAGTTRLNTNSGFIDSDYSLGGYPAK